VPVLASTPLHRSPARLRPPQAAQVYRETIIAPFIVKYAKKKGKELDLVKVQAEMNNLHNLQLGATLANLSPVNTLRVWAVPLTVA
jgi:hypothetical protein